SANGHEDCVDILLNYQADPLSRDCNGTSPLHLAAACGHIGILSSLLQVCGTGNILDDRGYTPLHWACYNGHDSCVDVLMEDENCQTFQGNPFSPLHCAV
ncbi:serine threonine- phosphatase 6 regulatory ankyrin repeat subunit A isoform X2, partial [Paramuricea clavata]